MGILKPDLWELVAKEFVVDASVRVVHVRRVPKDHLHGLGELSHHRLVRCNQVMNQGEVQCHAVHFFPILHVHLLDAFSVQDDSSGSEVEI